MSVTICQFDSGVKITAKTAYAKFKEEILKAGRFSVFEATDNARSARMFTTLCKDPEIETEIAGFPWTLVRRKI